MPAQQKVTAYGPVFNVTLNGTVTRRSLLAYDGTNFADADADWTASNPLYARVVALRDGVSADVIPACYDALFEDDDAPYTLGDKYYLSATAGELTATRPTGAINLMQVVGQAVTTSAIRVHIEQLREAELSVNALGVDSVFAKLDSGNFGGFTVDAQNEVVHFVFATPQNYVSTQIAYLWLAAEATGGTPTFDFFASGAVDGDQWDANTQDSTIAGSADEGAAADEIQRTTVTTGLDAAGVMEPGNIVGVRVLAADSGTDIRFHFVLQVVVNVV